MVMTEEEFNCFSSDYFRFEAEKDYEVVLANWRLDQRQFNEGEAPHKVVAFDVLKVNGVEYAGKPLIWSTKSRSFISQVKPYLLAAQRAGRSAVRLFVRYRSDRSYMVMSPETIL